MASHDRHLDENEVELYSMGEIPEGESARVEEHLLICSNCQQRVAQSDVYVAAMRFAAKSVRTEEATAKVASKTHFWKESGQRTRARTAGVVAMILAGASLAIYYPVHTRFRATKSQPFAVSLVANRGIGMPQVPAARDLEIACDLTGLPHLSSYRLEVVSGAGQRIRQMDTTGRAKIPALAQGAYFVRLYTPDGQLLREYGLQVGEL
jgi:hypothetical protein